MHPSRSLCRLCAKPFESSSLLHIFDNQNSLTTSLDALFKRYLPFSVSVKDNLTHYVCKLCIANVVRWHRFLTLCTKAQDSLKSVQGKLTQGDAPLSQNKTPQVDFGDSRVIDQSKSLNTAKKKKSNYCVARWCNNSNDIGIPFFRVPKDRKRALQWLSAADRTDLADKDLAYLYRCYMCATHFAKEMFVNENCKSLNRNAIPSIFPKPVYAQKIEEALNNAETYPKHLLGVRLKNILPKSVQKLQEISTEGCSSSPQSSRSYAPLMRLLHEPHEKQENPLQEVLFIRDTMQRHSNIQIISMFPMAEDTSETMQVMEVQGTKDFDPPQILTTLTNERVAESVSSNSHSEVFVSSKKQLLSGEASTFTCDNIQTESNCQKTKEISLLNNSNSAVVVSDAGIKTLSFRTDVNPLSNSDIGFRCDVSYDDNDTVMMLDLDQKAAKTKNSALSVLVTKNTVEDEHKASESLGLHSIPAEHSLTSNVAAGSSYSARNTASLLQENLNFCLKESTSKDIISDCRDNTVGTQDFLLMHSSDDHIEPTHNHGLRQDKNLNNLCCTARDIASETSSVYGDRSMMTEGSVRAIECTSPNHGQIIEGLIDLDQFLDSG